MVYQVAMCLCYDEFIVRANRSTTVSSRSKRKPQPRLGLVKVIVGLLVLEFVLGVLASMVADSPKQHALHNLNTFGLIPLHIVVGTLLLALGGLFLAQTSKQRHKYRREAIGGLCALVAAYACGELFVFTRNDLLSFAMAMSFIGALLPYARVMYLAQPR
jgi:heme A synthase